MKGVDNVRAEIERVTDVARIEEVIDRPIGRLSKGYRQRVGFAQALLGDPPILILDEPTAGLDPRQIIEVRELIRGLGGDHTVILSTHILPEVSMTCGAVVIINQGRVVAVDTPGNLNRRLTGADRIALTVRGPADEVEERLVSLPHVLAVQAQPQPEGTRATECRGGCQHRHAGATGQDRGAGGLGIAGAASGIVEPGRDFLATHDGRG